MQIRYYKCILRDLSSVGRALPLQGKGQEFDSPRFHPRTIKVFLIVRVFKFKIFVISFSALRGEAQRGKASESGS
jgi:hypothetical protein